MTAPGYESDMISLSALEDKILIPARSCNILKCMRAFGITLSGINVLNDDFFIRKFQVICSYRKFGN